MVRVRRPVGMGQNTNHSHILYETIIFAARSAQRSRVGTLKTHLHSLAEGRDITGATAVMERAVREWALSGDWAPRGSCR